MTLGYRLFDKTNSTTTSSTFQNKDAKAFKYGGPVHFKMIKIVNLNFMCILSPLEKKRKMTLLMSGDQIILGA